MARILFLTELLPYPLVAGPKTRAYYVLRHLAQQHEVTLLTFTRADDPPKAVQHLQSFLHQVVTVPMQRSLIHNVRAVLMRVLTGRPAIIARENLPSMRNKVRELLASGDFDAVHADQIPMAQFALLAENSGARLVLDQHNATYQIIERMAASQRPGIKRWLLQTEARAFARYEVQVCRRFDHVTFVTDVDRDAVASQAKREPLDLERTSVIPICVDTQKTPLVERASEPFRVTIVGTMYWPPNIEGVLWFWEQVWPRIHEQVPHARLTLIGKNPPERLLDLGRRPDVDVTGYVDDLSPYLAETAAFIVPLHAGGGMRVKIVDAWCWGTPIVSTTVGAEGIELQDGITIRIADAPADFAQAIIEIFNSPELSERLRLNGRRWVEERYDWNRVYPAWDPIYA